MIPLLQNEQTKFKGNASYNAQSEPTGTVYVMAQECDVTLGAAAAGLNYTFVQTQNNELALHGNSDLIFKSTVTGTEVRFMTSGQLRGAQIAAVSVFNQDDAAWHWMIINLSECTLTLVS